MSDKRYGRTIVRYNRGMRSNHWLVAIAFVLLALSGLALFHPSMYWLTNLFGGGPWTRILHPWIGLVMFVLFLIMALRVFSHNLMSGRDWAWLRHSGDVINRRDGRVPESGRYNGGQKLVFFVQIITLIGLLVTGFLMWRDYHYLVGSVSVGTIRLASLLHAVFAFILICTIIIHVYAGIWVKGSMQAMTRGRVSEIWAWKHHRAWWRRTRGQASTE